MSIDLLKSVTLATAIGAASVAPAFATGPSAPMAPATMPATALSTPNFIRMARIGFHKAECLPVGLHRLFNVEAIERVEGRMALALSGNNV